MCLHVLELSTCHSKGGEGRWGREGKMCSDYMGERERSKGEWTSMYEGCPVCMLASLRN